MYESQQLKKPEAWRSIDIYCYYSRMKCDGCLKAKLGYDPRKQDDYCCTVPSEVIRALNVFGPPRQAPKATKKAAIKLLLEAGIEAPRKDG